MDWRVNDQTISLDTQIKMKKYRCERGDATIAFKCVFFFVFLFGFAIPMLWEYCVCVWCVCAWGKNCKAIRFDFDISQRIKVYTFRIESNDRKIYAINLLVNHYKVQCNVFFSHLCVLSIGFWSSKARHWVQNLLLYHSAFKFSSSLNQHEMICAFQQTLNIWWKSPLVKLRLKHPFF